MMGDNRDNSTDSRVLSPGRLRAVREHRRPRRRSSSSRSPKASAPGRSGAGHGRCAGAGCSRSCDEPQGRRPSAPAPTRSRRTRRPERRARNQRRRRDRHQAPPKRAAALEERIGYRFADAALLERALTHISALMGQRSRGGSYQRLEFLGDHVLGLAVSDMLFRAYPKADEGELSRRLADLVRKETCADVARAIDLGAAIRLGASEAQRRRPAAHRRSSADVCEALIGAVFLDGGYAAAAALVERFWGERMLTPARPLRDAKTLLQEWAQARGLPTPAYREVGAHRAAPRSGIPRRRRAAGSRAGGRHRALQARRRAGGRRRHAGARGRVGPHGWLTPASRRRGDDALRLRRADRRAQCRQVDAAQRAGRRQGRDRHPQGADDARAGARDRDRGRGAARLRRHARHLRAAAPARPRHGGDRLERRARRRPRRPADRCAQRASTTRPSAILDRLGDVRQPKVLILNKIDVVEQRTLLALAQTANARAASPRPS